MADIPRVNPADMARLITENLANPGSIPGGESSPLPFDPAPDEQPATATQSRGWPRRCRARGRVGRWVRCRA